MSGQFDVEKQKWITLIDEYASFSNTSFVHWFFGKMTKEQVGQFVYKQLITIFANSIARP